MSHPTPPVKPVPYIADGDDGWLYRVRVPSYGLWERSRGRASLTWTAFEQQGADYHVTIDSTFLGDYNADPDTHVSSNDEIDGYRVHWPQRPGVILTEDQQAWLDGQDTARFNGLIAAFSQRLRSFAGNIGASRAYDTALAQYRLDKRVAAAAQRVTQATYNEDLAGWVNGCDEGDYQAGFRRERTYYFLDANKGVVLRLDPLPLRIKRQDGELDPGFVNMCKGLTTVAPLTPARLPILDNGLVLLSIVETKWAMLKSDFVSCRPAGDLMSLDQLVAAAVQAWTKSAESGPAFEVMAFDETLMNVTGPNRAGFHLLKADRLSAAELEQHGTSAGLVLAPPLHPDELPDGVFQAASSGDIVKSLPEVVQIRHDGASTYLFKDKLQPGWSKELKNAKTIAPKRLADNLVKYRFYAENLKIADDKVGLIAYLWPERGGQALYLGLKEAVAADATVSKSSALVLERRQARALVTALEPSEATTNQDAIVICNNSGDLFDPPIFASKSGMQTFNYDKAKADYLEIQKAKERREAQAKEEAAAATQAVQQAATASYPAAWDLLVRAVATKASAKMDLHKQLDGKLVAVLAGEPLARGATLVGDVSVTKTDKKLTTKSPVTRFLEFTGNNDQSTDWVSGLIAHVGQAKPKPPSGIGRYLLALKK
jgi:hypothetical protein